MIRIAIIGTGAVAEIHIQAFKAFQDRCEVRALADLYPEKAEKLAGKHGISAVVCKDFREVVARDDIDLVSVCLPPSVHAEAAIAALEMGKHAIVEKPMASSLEECDAMIQAAEKNGRILASIAQNRYKIPMMKVKKIIESGTAGRVLHATMCVPVRSTRARSMFSVLVMIACVPPCSRKSSAASIFGCMLPLPNWPSAR